MSEGIAIVGMACRYPDAASPAELWESVLARRRAFRRIPPERLRLEDYLSADRGEPDSLYAGEAAVLTGYGFDRARFRVAGSSYRAADLAHWLALDVAAAALADAGFAEGAGLPRDSVGVLVGNSLTGEFSRAGLMRLRWPYVRRVLAAGLAEEGWEARRVEELMRRLEASYKRPFPPPSEETLAGGLSNTIAGRICNHFDLHGGGYTVDGACASSLLAVANACSALAAGDLDVALAGGVDLSIDPFELIGFARNGALAAGEMRVYDARSDGFIPGEGCGFVVLMRERQAWAWGCRVYALIRGWGISSDGHGGISRPVAEGQRRALARAYRRAGFGIDTVGYFEGHGTGTAVGDATELRALSQALREAGAAGKAAGAAGEKAGAAGEAAQAPLASRPAPPIGSIKANIGHTKAAAGVAGLIKATMAVHTQLLPPNTGCTEPRAELTGETAALRVLARAEPWPGGQPLRAGVSAMGFGGINAHVVVEQAPAAPRRGREWSAHELTLLAAGAAAAHDGAGAELMLLAAAGRAALQAEAERLLDLAPRLSRAELADLSAALYRRLETGLGRSCRAAVIASTGQELAHRLGLLIDGLRAGCERRIAVGQGVFLHAPAAERKAGEPPAAETAGRVGLLFPGQGSPANAGGGAWRGRFMALEALYASVEDGAPRDGQAADGTAGRVPAPMDTAAAQPAIIANSLAGLWLLRRMGIEADVALGHSLGELAALHWAGACSAADALGLAAERGRAMSGARVPARDLSGARVPACACESAGPGSPPGGAMVSIAAPPEAVAELLATALGTKLGAPGAGAREEGASPRAVIAAFNGPSRTVVSGEAGAVEAVAAAAAARGLAATPLRVSHAFHSPLMAPALPRLARALDAVSWAPPARPVASTITGALLGAGAGLPALLLAQLTSPVRFTAALAAARDMADLWIEVGPGQALGELAGEVLGKPVVSLDAGGSALGGALAAGAAGFCLGFAGDLDVLFAGRFTRPFDPDQPLQFLANPCESAPPPVATPGMRQPAAEAGIAGAVAGIPEADAAGVPAGAMEVLTGAMEGPTGAPAVVIETHTAASPAETHPAAAPLERRPAVLEILRQLVAERAELPAEAVRETSRLLADLHLNSITVGQLVVEASRRLGLPPPAAPTDYAHATIAEVAQALTERLLLEALGGQASGGAGERRARSRGPAPPGVDTWVRCFTVELVERPLPPLRHMKRHCDVGVEDCSKRLLDLPPQPLADPLPGFPEAPGPFPALPGGKGTPPPYRAKKGFSIVNWRVFAPPGDPLAAALLPALASLNGPRPAGRPDPSVVSAPGDPDSAPAGVALVLPFAVGEEQVDLFLAAARAVLAVAGPSRFVVVQRRGGGGGFARTLHLELPEVTTCVVDLPAEAGAQAAELVAREAAAAQGYVEAHYDAAGRRRVPALRHLPDAAEPGAAAPAPAATPAAAAAGAGLGAGDVLLVSGGGKGIAAECALDLALGSGARLALLGRSDPAADRELAANLERMAAAGVSPLYVRADVTDAAAVRAAVGRVQEELGPVTALLHAAGSNEPRALGNLDAAAFLRTVAPKVGGARHLLAALDAGRLRLLVGFGSIIARTGLPGEADYAAANEWLGRLIERYGREHPACRCLVVDWSVWAGLGMGERLGTMESLSRAGITPLPPPAGVAALRRLLDRPPAASAVVVAGRFGEPSTLEVERPELPLRRFLERPRVYYPGIELVADTELSAGTDPYLSDHVFRGEPLFAAVLGLEAMAQVAMALADAAEPPVFEGVEFRRPVAVTPGRAATIRVAALARAPGVVEVVLRDGSTGFAVDHFRAVCRFSPALAASPQEGGDEPRPVLEAGRLSLDPPSDLYGGLLFHRGRFQRLDGYRRLRATECLAEISPDGATSWFGHFLPAELVLGDPAARDAAIHGIQACIPHASLLPIGAERIHARALAADAPLLLAARERRRDGDTFIYDLEILRRDGTLCERWEGLRLRAVGSATPPRTWPAALLAPYLERRLEEILPGAGLLIALEPRGPVPPGSDERRLPGHGPPRLHRPDGRPETAGAASGRPGISVAYAGNLVFSITSPLPVGCDLEAVAERPSETWRDLLGGERYSLAELIARDGREPRAAAATRVWAAAESLRKLGAPQAAPLTLESSTEDGWVLLRSGRCTVATFAPEVREAGGRCALAVVAGDLDPVPPH
ncbi:MAG TPA: SDR family NAD(P)-dependent oxidoreductase [Thermoanaerobaculia bacterium]|nr:SDR family NAD(P)-dependent oxidoreductase [Thermoanaerobaculia bacterium]